MYVRVVRLQVNGKRRELGAGATIADLIADLGLRIRTVVVERNGEPVERSRFSETELADGDVIEVVRPVQGGAPV